MPNGDTNGNGNGNGRDPMAGLPWWIRAIVIVGVPSAIAMGLVWSNQVQLADKTAENNVFLRQIVSESRDHDARVLLRFESLGDKADETNRILLAGCVNDAKNTEARERCVGRR
jgi:hypothetical protein